MTPSENGSRAFLRRFTLDQSARCAVCSSVRVPHTWRTCPASAVTPPRNQGKRAIGLPGVWRKCATYTEHERQRRTKGKSAAPSAHERQRGTKGKSAAPSAAAPAGAVQAPPRPLAVRRGGANEPPTPCPQEHHCTLCGRDEGATVGGWRKGDARAAGEGGGGRPTRADSKGAHLNRRRRRPLALGVSPSFDGLKVKVH